MIYFLQEPKIFDTHMTKQYFGVLTDLQDFNKKKKQVEIK